MVMRLIDPEQPIRWIHPIERDNPAHATVFCIVPLSEGVARKIKAAHPTRITNAGATMNEDVIRRDVFLSQVVRIDNVQWPGSPETVSITSVEDREHFFDSMPAQYGAAIYAAIQNTGDLDRGDVKNFEGSSGSSKSWRLRATMPASTVETSLTSAVS